MKLQKMPLRYYIEITEDATEENVIHNLIPRIESVPYVFNTDYDILHNTVSLSIQEETQYSAFISTKIIENLLKDFEEELNGNV